ncbi:MAG TPA: flavohemoglobin expression-modulating QEGLA motif protein [Polyangiaceae bacterium]|nr:flavohemoglobin expression-modulating QEGLA motif protein [Polyangiaceae bacterium]
MDDSLIPGELIAEPAGPWRSYKERVSVLAQRLVEAQRPLRVLNAIKWPADVFERFSASSFREMPRVGPQEYERLTLGFDPRAKVDEFRDIELSVASELGSGDAIGRILSHSAREYASVVEMLKARGTPRFYELSRQLYGSAKEVFADDVTRVRDVALDMYELLTNLDDAVLGPQPERTIPASEVVHVLNARLNTMFGDGVVRVIVDDGIIADAAAGSDYVKIRDGALFSHRDIRVLEVHEGWVHLATSLNGQQQPVARWLAKGPPRTLATQEGLAALLEVLTLTSHPSRARRLNDRVLAVDKAEDGASFLDVFEWFRTEGYTEEVCFWNTQRIFRGGVLSGGAPFTKDIVYTKGIVSNYNFLRSAIAAGRPELIRWLFVGKVALEDIPVLAARSHEGVVSPPRYIPDMFRDLNGLAIWLGISSFWGRLKNRAVHRHYERLFETG